MVSPSICAGLPKEKRDGAKVSEFTISNRRSRFSPEPWRISSHRGVEP